MASDTQLTLYGLWHLAGQTVQASIGGLDCGDYVVAADGSITVPFGSDDQGLMTPQYLASLDGYEGEQATPIKLYVDDTLQTITVPVVIGLGYTSDGQTLRPVNPNDLMLRTHGLGKLRRAHYYSVLLHNAVEISFGTDFSSLDPALLTTTDGETANPHTSLYSGVYRGTLTDQSGYDSMLAWRVDRPWPATVCATGTILVAGDG